MIYCRSSLEPDVGMAVLLNRPVLPDGDSGLEDKTRFWVYNCKVCHKKFKHAGTLMVWTITHWLSSEWILQHYVNEFFLSGLHMNEVWKVLFDVKNPNIHHFLTRDTIMIPKRKCTLKNPTKYQWHGSPTVGQTSSVRLLIYITVIFSTVT